MKNTSAHSKSFVRTFNVYFIFSASGAAALIYQIIWSRWLGLLFGNTTTSITIILGSFMMGLALGSQFIGRRLSKIKDPMKLYALLELFIGCFAILFPALTYLVDIFYMDIIPLGLSEPFRFFIMTLLAFCLICIPTTMMGATLPLLTDFFHRSPRHTTSWKVGLLYAINTLGAALGSIASGFFLIELVGIRSTTLIAAALNFAIAFAGLRFSRSTILAKPVLELKNEHNLKLNGNIALFVLTAGGGIAMASEVLWTRPIEMLVGNSTYAFSMILVLYLLGIAFGSWLMSLFVNKLRKIVYWMVGLQVSMGVWMFIAAFLFNSVGLRLSQLPDITVSWLTIILIYLKVISILLPLAILSGAVFPVATRIIDPESKDAQGVMIAKAYSWNTMGALVGSLIGGFAIAPFFDYFTAVYILGILYSVVAFISLIIIVLGNQNFIFDKILAYALSAVSIIMIGFGFFQVKQENQFIDKISPLYDILSHKPGLQGITSVLKFKGENSASNLLVNGRGMTVKVTDTKMMAHIPMLLHPNPQNTLVICFGMGTTYRSAISHGGKVTVVELVKEVFDAFEYFFADARYVRDYDKGDMIVNDGRNFLKLTQQKFDIITIDPPPPIDGAGVNNLYSQDFAELAKSKLAPGGIMAHWIPYPGAGSGVDDWDTFAMLVYSFGRAFPYVYTIKGFHGVGLHLFGSEQPIMITKNSIKEGLKNPSVLKDITEWDAVTPRYFDQLKPLKFPNILPLPITDDRPRLEFNLLRTWHLPKNHGYSLLLFNG